MEKWQRIDFEFCPECFGNIEVFTMADDNQCYDGDFARCVDCTFHSVMSVDEDGVAWLQDSVEPSAGLAGYVRYLCG